MGGARPRFTPGEFLYLLKVITVIIITKPKTLLSPELVIDAAQALVREGIEPSIINVQGRIGGGSYTTVKRHLDTWRQRQAEQASAVDLPPEFVEQGNALTRALWRAAQQWAEREVKLVREQAAADIQAAQREQAAALEELRRLEQVEAEQSQALEQAAQQTRKLELQIAALRVEAERAATLEKELQRTRAETIDARAEAQRWRQQAEQHPSVETILTELRTKVDALSKPKQR